MRLSLILLLIMCNDLLANNQSQTVVTSVPIIHQIYQLVDQRNASSPIFTEALASGNIEIQNAALIGLGRIGEIATLKQIIPFLNHEQSKLRQSAALAIGISGDKTSAKQLWQRLEKENVTEVKKEIYLGLGNLAPDELLTKMLEQLEKETSASSQSDLFQSLAIALTFHRDIQADFSRLNYSRLLKHFAKGNEYSAMAGYFLSRIPEIEKYVTTQDLLTISKQAMSITSKINLARLIGKVSILETKFDREMLVWVIEQTESSDLNLQIEAIRALRNFTRIPQTLIQLGKFQAASNPIVAHTALGVIADSSLKSQEVITLLKNKLKDKNPALVVEAISGLIKRQTKEEMSWVVTLFKHKSSYVKINLLQLLKNKSATEFDNLIRFFTQDPDQAVARYASGKLQKPSEPQSIKAESPSFDKVIEAAEHRVTLKTADGDITIELLADAPYTSWHFLNNAKQGLFHQSYFSRVIGNFVAQGGDTIGDREGASPYSIREEINLLSHEPLTVGMATSGKDTGSSQFFINTARNPHLDRNYTVFGKIIAGGDIVMRMSNGVSVLDVIID